MQLTIEHDPDSISRRRQTFLKPKSSLPLTTTSSDTNIPNKKNKIPTDSSYFGSTDSINDLSNISDNLEMKNLNSTEHEINDNKRDTLSVHNNNNNNINVISSNSSNIGNNKSPKSGSATRAGDKERLFKRRDEGYMSGTRSRQLRRKNNSSETRQSLDKERSSSMSRLLDE